MSGGTGRSPTMILARPPVATPCPADFRQESVDDELFMFLPPVPAWGECLALPPSGPDKAERPRGLEETTQQNFLFLFLLYRRKGSDQRLLPACRSNRPSTAQLHRFLPRGGVPL